MLLSPIGLLQMNARTPYSSRCLYRLPVTIAKEVAPAMRSPHSHMLSMPFSSQLATTLSEIDEKRCTVRFSKAACLKMGACTDCGSKCYLTSSAT